MKISIIGAGNMGGAIARGLAAKGIYNICVSNPSEAKLVAIKNEFPKVETTTDNKSAVAGADIVVLAVKPWLVQTGVEEVRDALEPKTQQIVSVAAGISTSSLSEWLGEKKMPVYYVIPNTAISIGRSMTFIASENAGTEQLEAVKSLFGELGETLVIEEKHMKACMALASCGIAYAMRYVRASVEGAVELGIRPDTATMIVANTMNGAAELLKATGNHPEMEIDKVTTPGGLTIKGLNALEAHGFTTAVIEALKASL